MLRTLCEAAAPALFGYVVAVPGDQTTEVCGLPSGFTVASTAGFTSSRSLRATSFNVIVTLATLVL